MSVNRNKSDEVQAIWSPRLVEALLIAAAETHRRLPSVNVPGFFNTWPPSARETRAGCFDEGAPSPAVPTPSEISAMERAMLWLRWLERDDQRIVWDRANGRPWKAIAVDLGVDRTTVWRRWKIAIAVIAARLNAADDATLLQHRDVQHV